MGILSGDVVADLAGDMAAAFAVVGAEVLVAGAGGGRQLVVDAHLGLPRATWALALPRPGGKLLLGDGGDRVDLRVQGRHPRPFFTC